MTWIGTDAWISWRGTAWDLRPSKFFTHTGTSLIWWLVRGILQVFIPRFSGGDPGGTAIFYHFKFGGGISGTTLDLVVERGAGGYDGWVREVLHHAYFSYVDEWLVASMDPVWLQGVFDTLPGFLAGWGSRKTSGRQWGYSAAPAMGWGTIWKHLKIGRRQCRY